MSYKGFPANGGLASPTGNGALHLKERLDAMADRAGGYNGRVVVVDSSGTNAQRGAQLAAAYTAAKLLSPTATDRVLIRLPEGVYDLTALRATQLGACLTLDTDYIDLASVSGNPWSTVITGSPQNNVVTGPVVLQTAIDVRCTGIWFQNIVANYGSDVVNSYACRGFEQQARTIATGNTGSNGDLEWVSAAAARNYLIYSATWDTSHAEFLNVLIGDWVAVSGGSITRPRAFKVVDISRAAGNDFLTLDPFENSVYDAVNHVYSHGGTAADKTRAVATGSAPDPNPNTAWTVYRTAANSRYIDCLFYSIGDEGTLEAHPIATGRSRRSSPWGTSLLDGSWLRCLGGANAWRVANYGHLLGTYTRCEAGDFAFAGDGTADGGPGFDNTHYTHLSATMVECRAGAYSYGGCTAFGGFVTNGALLVDCTGGKACVATGREMAGTVQGGRYGRDSVAGYTGNDAANTDSAVSLLGRLSGRALNVFTEGGDSFGQGTGLAATPVAGVMGVIDTTYATVQGCQSGYNLSVATTNNTATFLQGISLANNMTYFVTASVTATGTAKNAVLRRTWMVTTASNAATVTAVNTADLAGRTGLTTADITLVAGAPGVQLKVTGEAATNLTWRVVDIRVLT